ncbi:MAG TPA: hypothetical protein VLT51_03895, partial [Anaerolineales bacterium]|nr:hypothetical protein [Anaerolineales bacterium]
HAEGEGNDIEDDDERKGDDPPEGFKNFFHLDRNRLQWVWQSEAEWYSLILGDEAGFGFEEKRVGRTLPPWLCGYPFPFLPIPNLHHALVLSEDCGSPLMSVERLSSHPIARGY